MGKFVHGCNAAGRRYIVCLVGNATSDLLVSAFNSWHGKLGSAQEWLDSHCKGVDPQIKEEFLRLVQEAEPDNETPELEVDRGVAAASEDTEQKTVSSAEPKHKHKEVSAASIVDVAVSAAVDKRLAVASCVLAGLMPFLVSGMMLITSELPLTAERLGDVFFGVLFLGPVFFLLTYPTLRFFAAYRSHAEGAVAVILVASGLAAVSFGAYRLWSVAVTAALVLLLVRVLTASAEKAKSELTIIEIEENEND
jgi:hypothetical protein